MLTSPSWWTVKFWVPPCFNLCHFGICESSAWLTYILDRHFPLSPWTTTTTEHEAGPARRSGWYELQGAAQHVVTSSDQFNIQAAGSVLNKTLHVFRHKHSAWKRGLGFPSPTCAHTRYINMDLNSFHENTVCSLLFLPLVGRVRSMCVDKTNCYLL